MRRCIAIFFMALSMSLSAAESEYDVKATYLFNFTQLVSWPSSAFTSPQSPLVIGVVGRDPFGGGLGAAMRGQKAAGGRSIEVRAVSASDSEALQNCHIVFVSSSLRAADIARAVQGHPVLIVGESDGFASEGGIIGFVLNRDKKVKLEINNDAARRAQVKINSGLLGLAKIVN